MREFPLVLEKMALSFLLLLLLSIYEAEGSRIVGGRDAAPHSRPYMASLQIAGQHICGGALIREDFVVSAAHCQLPVPFTVVLGVDSFTSNESTKQEIKSTMLIPHQDYDGHNNDIMLLKLDRKAQLGEAVQLIPLKRNRLRVNQCIAAGWGDVGDNNTRPNTLQEVNVTTLSHEACRRTWKKVGVPIARSMVCGVGGRPLQGFCSGDSGGPLVCDGEVAGVVSFSGRQCGNPRTPDVYTRISSFSRWIASQMNSTSTI